MMNIDKSTLGSLPSSFNVVLIGASGGIGSALCEMIAGTPHLGKLTTLSRKQDRFDLTDEASIAEHAAALADSPIHLLICATGVLTVDEIPPEKALKHLKPDIMAS
jgi:NAD(P)-dependent dehydrogenase (short-subunit alcohol dehydrogenase family)